MEDAIRAAIRDMFVELGVTEADFAVEHPADLSHGDYATNAALSAAKTLGKNPRELAEEIVVQLEGKIEGVAAINIAGPGFINFHLSRDFFTQQTESIRTAGDAWGQTNQLANQTWIIEHTSPNPNKAMHIGHLRNNITGMAMVRLAELNGAEVIADAIDNNRGIAIAKLMWGYLRFAHQEQETNHDVAYWHEHQSEWQTPEMAGMYPDRFVDDLYVKGNTDFEVSKAIEGKVRQLVVDWEAGDELVRKLWETVLQYSHAGQQRTLDRLGSRWDKVWHEDQHYQQGKDLVEQGLATGVFRQLPDCAILTNLERYNLSDTIVQKSDGTSLYITQDLALTKLKKDTYQADKFMWVIGPDQTLALQQVFAVCEQLGIGKLEEFEHLSYGYMSIKGEGKMSSRKGTVLYIDDVIDYTKAQVEKNIAARELASEVAEDIALAAIKYVILRAGRTTDIAFDIEQATEFEGDTGPYLQYTHARICSVLEKAAAVGIVPAITTTPSEPYELEKLLYRYPEVIAEALADRAPHKVIGYVTELAGAFNSFYAQEKIADASDEYAPYKAAVADAVRQTLKNGLWVLGIKAPEQM